MLDFLLGILIPLKLLLLVWFAWQLLHWLLWAAAGPSAPQSNSETPCINNKVISSMWFDRPGVRARPAWNQSESFNISHLSSHWIRDIGVIRKRKDWLWFVGTNGLEITHILMNGMMGLGNLSTEKEINRLRHGLESCIVCLVRFRIRLEVLQSSN